MMFGRRYFGPRYFGGRNLQKVWFGTLYDENGMAHNVKVVFI